MKNHVFTAVSRIRILVFLMFYVFAFMPVSSTAQIVFSDVSSQAGFQGFLPSYGASWGDVNGDGWPDLFENNHARRNSIYLNNQNGTFTDAAQQLDVSGYWLNTGGWEDTHGGTWADFDNDGDQDLLISTGQCCNVQFFVNENGMLYYRSEESGFTGDADLGGRMPIWFDMDDDGLLEVALITFFRAPLMTQSSGIFIDAVPGSGFVCNGDQFATLVDLNADGRMEVLCVTKGGSFAPQVYDTTTLPFQNVTSWLPDIINVNDVILGDFDGNLRTDLLLLRGLLRPSEVEVFNGNLIEAHLAAPSGGKSFSFETTGVLSVKLDWNKTWVSFGNIFIGATGSHPAAEEFVLDPADSTVWGLKACEPGTFPQICIGYDQNNQSWEFQWETGEQWVDSYLEIESTAGISNLYTEGLSGHDLPVEPALLSNLPAGIQDATAGSGLDERISCVSGVAGDFDNDMDEDIYLVCRGGVQNLENRLYENDGDGTFTLVPGVGGANSVTGAAVADHAGTGDSVVVADYDVDGLLDLFVTNGLNMRPQGGDLGGPDQLFNNIGNSRQWIEIDLVGTISNRDGIGARVYATAGGVTQLRSQNGGYHRWSQNYQRIHFGLADNTLVDLQVNWPSGVIDVFTGIPSGHLYRITENTGIEEVSLQSGGLQPGDECNAPSYDKGAEANVFLWKDCDGSQLWHMRATAGGSPSLITYAGAVTADQAFSSVTPFSFESSDVLDNSTDPLRIDYTLKMVNAGQDGFDFSFPVGANACFDTNLLPAGAQVLLGLRRVPITVPFGLETLESCQNAPPPPGGANECGAPDYDSSVDDGLFIWKDCDTDAWHLRAMAGSGFARYIGNMVADQDFANVTGISVESNDVVGNTPPSRVDFDLRMSPPWFDGIDFSIPCSAAVSFNLTSPVGADVHLGPARVPVPVPFNLTDFGSCGGI